MQINTIKLLFFKYIPLIILSTGTVLAASEPPAPAPAQQLLLEKMTELPSNKVDVRIFRMIIPVGYKSPLHTHEGPGPRYVLKGKIRIEEGGQTHDFGPGEVFWETGQWMTAENIAQTETELLIIELPKAK
jgi:quercetin dioxygenase-like cupin family protein